MGQKVEVIYMSGEKKKLITTSNEGDNIVIQIPVGLLKNVQKHRENGYKITDKKAMASYIAENIVSFGEDSETGITVFEELIDRLFDEAYEEAEEWLEEIKDGYEDD